MSGMTVTQWCREQGINSTTYHAVPPDCSMIETAKKNGNGPYRYLCWVLEHAPKLMHENGWAEKLLPWMIIEKVKKSDDEDLERVLIFYGCR